jgi:peptide/nickel transport system permease protein
LIWPQAATNQVGYPFTPPSFQHPLGLDDAGYDMLALVVYGARISLAISVLAALLSIAVGGTVGVLAGYFGGWVEVVLMRITDYFLVLPVVPLMIVVAALWGPDLWRLIIVIGLLLWTWPARLIRSQVKSLRERTYVRRAVALGAGPWRTIVNHVVPHIMPLLVANAVLTVATAVFAETTLSFLGLGDPTAISWGRIMENAFNHAAITSGAWWAIVPPGVCVAVVIIACSMVGRAVEDHFNPRLATAYLSVRTFQVHQSHEEVASS